ncbi:glycosyltransferase family 2 protein [Flavobacterium sp. J27]|uniref:glycosyltransferase family 2 protein n=1 Tax=Flavobacterium sp. J27 TaxID=2060419 RepID=UPI0010302EDF|nr:galactosyltransferase-related protein [Flavobacterium sp. J27]
MITLVITNRNRDLSIVKKCLDSLKTQSVKEFKCFFVDYGSHSEYVSLCKEIIENYDFVTAKFYPVSGQLWNKSRAINTVLKECTTASFFVGDIDMIFAPNFIAKLYQMQSLEEVFYFQVGFLSQEESLLNKTFDAYKTAFLSNKEATGMTFYPTHLLKELQGYDEFYHGWGAEDTDVHVRLLNSGISVKFYDEEVLMKHQWHPKQYRSSYSTEPFHSLLEQVNHNYLKLTQKNQIKKANTYFEYGLIPVENEYEALQTNEMEIHLTNEKNELQAFLQGTLFNLQKGVYTIKVSEHKLFKDTKNWLKMKLGKKHLEFYNFEEITNLILSVIIVNFRNNPYYFEYKKKEHTIILRIKL